MKRTNSMHKYLDNIARTAKDKGVPLIEDKFLWHYRDLQGADFANVLKKVEKTMWNHIIDELIDFASKDDRTSKIGSQEYLRDYYGMNADKVFVHIVETYKL